MTTHTNLARQSAQQLILEMGLSEPNIDIFQLASAKECQIKFFRPEGELAHVSGFLEKEARIIYVNNEDPPKRQIFTIAHELGHLLLDHAPNEYGVLPRFKAPTMEDESIEGQANCFAGCLLVPEDMLRRAMKKYDLAPQDTGMLSNLFGVSEEIIRIRLNHLS